MTNSAERTRFGGWARRTCAVLTLGISVGIVSGCDSLLEVELPATLTDAALEDPKGALTQVNSVIAQFECGYSDFVWEAFGNEDGGQYITTVGSGVHNYPATVATGSCGTNPRGIAYWNQFQRSRKFADRLHAKLEKDWTVQMVPERTRYMAISSLYAGASIGWMGSTLCDMDLDAGSLMTPAQTHAVALGWLDKAITEIGQVTGGDFALPYGISTSALNTAYGLRAQIKWMAGDNAGALADAKRIPKGFFAYVTRELGPERMNMPQNASSLGYSELYDVNDWWKGPANPVTGQAWASPIPFTGWRALGILPDGRAVRADGLPIRTAGLYRTAAENAAVADTRVKTATAAIQGGKAGPVAARYAAEADDIPMVNWKEMWLIRAELEGGQTAITLVNELRADAGLPLVTYANPANATEIRYMIIEERRRALFQEGRYYYTKIKNTDLLWFPRASGRTPTAGWNLSGGVRYVMPDDEYTLNTNLTMADRATGCEAKQRPTLIGG